MTEVKDLGVVLDQKLLFERHAEEEVIVAKLRKYLDLYLEPVKSLCIHWLVNIYIN